MPRTPPEIIRHPGTRAAARRLLLALALAGAAWYFGADPWHAVLLGGLLATALWVTAVVTLGGEGEQTDWPDIEDGDPSGARTDIARLSVSLRGRRGRVSDTSVAQVRRIAERRLAERELNLRNPADRARIEQLIGGPAYRLLVRGRLARQPTLRALVRCLDRLDALEAPRHGKPSRV
jgi:hypothetical protein